MAKVLVVEDDAAIRQLLTLHLESEAHDVLTAEDGVDGLQQAIATLPDLIVSDFQMPRIDGIGMLAGLRANERTAAIPFIFLTEVEDEDLRERSRSLQVSDYLIKPFDRARLLRAVTKHARLRRPRRPTRDPTALAELADQMETMAMAPQYAVPLPYPETGGADGQEVHALGTVVFFAIRDFVRIAEALGEDQQIALVSAFQEQVGDVVARNSGWVVKTTDGGFIAMFDGHDAKNAQHAERAIKAAILCVLALHRFGPWIAGKLDSNDIPALAAIVGVHSGEVSICNLHDGRSGGRSERTIIGDTVNVAARLQARAGELGWGIVCSEAALQRVGPRIAAGRREKIRIKGRSGSLDIVEVTALRPKAGADRSEIAFYGDIVRAIGANTSLIEAQNTLQQTGTADISPAAVPTAVPEVEAEVEVKTRQGAATQREVAVKTRQGAATKREIVQDREAQPDGAAAAPVAIDGYHILRKVGEGGVAQVFLADHARSGTRRVLKLLPLTGRDDGEMVKRFVQEYALLMRISHPNVAQVHQHGHQDGYAYMAMEYFSGGDLRGLMRHGCSVEMAVAALIQVAGGLAAVHAIGVVHRDLKPDNIMLREDGSLAIADFGIAKRVGDNHSPTQHGDVLGTPYYLSPEQALGIPTDQRADIYSLGVMFYEMLARRRAYDAESAMALLQQHVQSPVPVLACDLARFQPLIDRMMCKQAAGRFASADEVVEFVHSGRCA